jgi:hypothetical protein
MGLAPVYRSGVSDCAKQHCVQRQRYKKQQLRKAEYDVLCVVEITESAPLKILPG